jgi:hypothetical protein
MFDLTLDCVDAVRVAGFWKVALGYEDEPPPAPFATRAEWLASYGEDHDPRRGAWLRDPAGIGPRLSILAVPEPKVVKNRLHIDVRCGGWEHVEAKVAELLAAGGTVVETFDGHHVVMSDPEGNELCVG